MKKGGNEASTGTTDTMVSYIKIIDNDVEEEIYRASDEFLSEEMRFGLFEEADMEQTGM